MQHANCDVVKECLIMYMILSLNTQYNALFVSRNVFSLQLNSAKAPDRIFYGGRTFVISASGSLDLVDLNGVGRPDWDHKGPFKGRGSTSYPPTPLARPKS